MATTLYNFLSQRILSYWRWVIDIFRRTLPEGIDSRPRVKEVSNYKDWGKLKGAVNQADTHRSCQ